MTDLVCVNDYLKKLYYTKFFHASHFVCLFCRGSHPLKDPVTLRCGHSFSKKCAIEEAERNDGIFTCNRCEVKFSISYLSSLGINILMASVINKFFDDGSEVFKKFTCSGSNCSCELCENSGNEPETKQNLIKIVNCLRSPLPDDCLKKGCKLVNIEKFCDSLHHYLICCSFASKSIRVKNYIFQWLHNYLTECPNPLESSPSRFSCGMNYQLIIEYLMDLAACNNEAEKKIIEKRGAYIYSVSIEPHNMCVDMDKFSDSIDMMTGLNFIKRRVNSLNVDITDFECSVCTRIFLEPYTTTCGHTFCKACYNRCLDYKTGCPLCKSVLAAKYSERVQMKDEFIYLVMNTKFHNDYSEREKSHLLEMHRLLNAGSSTEELPLFIGTIVLPTAPCLLHIFDNLYRHMIRKCLESGIYKFGMIAKSENRSSSFGTVLEIQRIRYNEDGTSNIRTVGTKRFHIIRRGECDGCQTALVEPVIDENFNIDSVSCIMPFQEQVHRMSQIWFSRLDITSQNLIIQHFGSIPSIEPTELYENDGPSWMWWMFNILFYHKESFIPLQLLASTSVRGRLKELENQISQTDPSIWAREKDLQLFCSYKKH